MKCKRCGKTTDKLWDGEVCTTCHDLWLEKMLNDPNLQPILRLNKFVDEIGLGGEDNGHN